MTATRRAIATTALSAALLVAGCVAGPISAAQAEEDDRLPSRVVLLSNHSNPVKTWSALPVRVRIENEQGVPLAGRNLRIWDDSYMRWRCCGPPPWRTTDANGEVSATLNLDGNSANPVRVAAYWHGDATYKSAIVEWYQPLYGYATSLTATHATQRTSGQTLPVTVSVRRTDPDRPNACIQGAVVPIVLSGPTTLSAEAVVEQGGDGSCTGTVEFDLSITPGTYLLTASTGHAGWLRTDEPSTYATYVEVRWQHVFSDASGDGTAYLNIATGQYRIAMTDGRDSGIRYAGSGLTKTGVSGTVNVWRIDLNHSDAEGEATGAFYSTGSFSARGHIRGSPWDLSR